MSKRNALITGAGGLIGSACAEYLASDGWRVLGNSIIICVRSFGPSGSDQWRCGGSSELISKSATGTNRLIFENGNVFAIFSSVNGRP